MNDASRTPTDDGERFGRWPGPRVPGVHAPWHRLKRWHYLALDGDGHYLALGLVHLGYVGQVFAYLVDKENTLWLNGEPRTIGAV